MEENRMDEILKEVEELGCKDEFCRLFYSVVSVAVSHDWISTERIIQHAESALHYAKEGI